MAYHISYYDRAMQHSQAMSDNIGEALANYPAPTGRETAFARHSENKELDAYGYDGAWHRNPPSEAYEADRKIVAEIEAREKIEEYARQPHVVGRLSHDHNTLVVSVPGQQQNAYLRVDELRQAARQPDAEGRAVYGRLLAEVEEKLASDWR